VDTHGISPVVDIVYACKYLPLIALPRSALVSHTEVKTVCIGQTHAVDIGIHRDKIEPSQRRREHYILTNDRCKASARDILKNERQCPSVVKRVLPHNRTVVTSVIA